MQLDEEKAKHLTVIFYVAELKYFILVSFLII